jgi:hypothetical protein
MGKEISLFSGYSQDENRTTNYCLLVLKMLYSQDPSLFEAALSKLVGDEPVAGEIGIHFNQQERRGTSVPDGVIRQNPVTIYIETKHFDWFYNSQLEEHLKSLAKENIGKKILIALSNFEQKDTDRFQSIEKICSVTYKDEIYFAAISFEDLLSALNELSPPQSLRDIISDFQSYLDEQGLLPRWANRLDVVNCSRWTEEVTEGKVYICPAEGGSYSHQRCKYFGMYSKKKVSKIAEIRAVVDVESESHAILKWQNCNDPSEKLLEEALQKLEDYRPGAGHVRVFLLDELYDTNFIKDSPGGMMGSKKYFDISEFKADTAKDLAEKLDGREWSEL